MAAPTTPAGGRGHGPTWRVPRRLGGRALAGDRRRGAGGVGGGGLARALAPRVRRRRDRAGGRGRPRRLQDTGAVAGLRGAPASLATPRVRDLGASCPGPAPRRPPRRGASRSPPWPARTPPCPERAPPAAARP